MDFLIQLPVFQIKEDFLPQVSESKWSPKCEMFQIKEDFLTTSVRQQVITEIRKMKQEVIQDTVFLCHNFGPFQRDCPTKMYLERAS